MARRPKQKMLTTLPGRFDPNFIDRLSKRYTLARIVIERRAELEAHLGGGDLSYIERALIKRLIWLELLTERYEQQVANGQEVDVGALSQLNNTLKGLYKDLGIKRRPRDIGSLSDYLKRAEGADASRDAA